MKDYTAIRERYLRDAVPVRLGGLAANLRRICTAMAHDANREVVDGLLDESKHFIEWTARETALDTAAELVVLQVTLASWQQRLAVIWVAPPTRQQIAQSARQWSDRVLALSGLLDA